ncbi:hypothetical protein [Geotalea uraniireducens]|uniref:pEK499-p136 HEPN domain-containing protein n=1 Tax=Geotalea uraniireducens (strain Rf4) TaxID=351605 RepID=A5G5I2_GEOUR|nr:hypothetical protein [Geotalea uraniireducens]ABQ27050.1 hypothetical protein Gura_2877 [Geotalea uraniireducens Rf4]
MSEYEDFVKDFPKRCQELLNLAERPALDAGREVTLMLMVAATALFIPFERLKPEGRQDHPSKDKERFPQAATELKTLLEKPFTASDLFDKEAKSWATGRLKSLDGAPDDWPELQRLKPISSEKKVNSIFKTIRNSLAHGNLYTRGGSEIKSIIFISTIEDRDKIIGFQFVSVSPADFRLFLTRWFEFLDKFHIDQKCAFNVVIKST